MEHSVQKRYLFDKDFDVNIFDGDNEDLLTNGLTYLGIHYEDVLENPKLWTSYWHHDSGTSLIVTHLQYSKLKKENKDDTDLIIRGLEETINQTLKAIKPLGELLEVK